MPRTCTITAAFNHRDGTPAHGQVRFTPSRLWVIQEGIAWACLAPVITLKPDGSFVAEVTATDTDQVRWYYIVETPAGDFTTYVPWIETGYCLRDLVNEHNSRPRP